MEVIKDATASNERLFLAVAAVLKLLTESYIGVHRDSLLLLHINAFNSLDREIEPHHGQPNNIRLLADSKLATDESLFTSSEIFPSARPSGVHIHDESNTGLPLAMYELQLFLQDHFQEIKSQMIYTSISPSSHQKLKLPMLFLQSQVIQCNFKSRNLSLLNLFYVIARFGRFFTC
jgi:hypothetical protein